MLPFRKIGLKYNTWDIFTIVLVIDVLNGHLSCFWILHVTTQRRSFRAHLILFIFPVHYLIEMKATFLFSGFLTIMRVQGFSPVSTSSRKMRSQYSFHERKPIHLFPTNMISVTSSSIAKLSVIPQSISFLHQDYMFVLSSLLIMSTFGIFLERKTMIGKSLSVGSIYPLSSPICMHV
jgi:hypothetical protein